MTRGDSGDSGSVGGSSGRGMSGAASQALATQAVRAKSDSKYVKLNVGGTLHLSTIDTLCKQDTMLRAMFSGRMDVLHDVEGSCIHCLMESCFIL